MLNTIRSRIAATAEISPQDLAIYEECVQHLLYLRYYPQFVSPNGRWKFYREFVADCQYFLDLPGKSFETLQQAAHVFACFRQIQRAFHHIFDNIIGNSIPAARLRASIWQSVFTHDMRRYRRTMYAKIAEFPTLITGPSGTGKELVARAIAGSRYVRFNVERLDFTDERNEVFLPINIAALSPALVESELFGHRRGAFTGAVSDRKGWLETCPVLGSVFLDELGEMDLSIQVKLLRVIETRKFSAVGDTAQREFHGKLIAATNRDLAVEIRERRFREDLYYRLCADLIETPSLAEQISDSPEVLHELLFHMTRRAVGDEAEQTMPEVESWISEHLPKDYGWPGNYRELEQCVRNIVIRRSYRPMPQGVGAAAQDGFFEDFRAGRLKISEVIAYYAALVYRQTGSYETAARRLVLDRRTVKAKVQEYLETRASGENAR
jgi:DNA-binding NtrC family response regulator